MSSSVVIPIPKPEIPLDFISIAEAGCLILAGAGSYQSSSKSTSPPWAAAATFRAVEVSLAQARYNKNNSLRVNEDSNSSKLTHEPVFIKISDSYLRSGMSCQGRGSLGEEPSSLRRKGLNPLRQP